MFLWDQNICDESDSTDEVTIKPNTSNDNYQMI